jgi:hypothetical protein
MDPITAIIMLVASFAISYALMPTLPDQKPENFEDIQFPQTEEGTAQAVIFGDCWSGDWAILALGNYRTTGIEADTGKK